MIRRATSEDAEAVGRLFVRARDEMTYLPRIPGEDRARLGSLIVERHETWVAEEDGHVIGFAQAGPGMLENLYVDPDAQGRGVGTALLDRVKRACPNGFEFWVFQQNEGARRFYEHHGCRLVELTDGAGNMEKEPDARYEWRPV
jgi:GNAT superfamily N-acetyltransferase